MSPLTSSNINWLKRSYHLSFDVHCRMQISQFYAVFHFTYSLVSSFVAEYIVKVHYAMRSFHLQAKYASQCQLQCCSYFYQPEASFPLLLVRPLSLIVSI